MNGEVGMNPLTSAGVTHIKRLVTHTGFSLNTPSDLGFYSLSTEINPGYYYYLYIQETLPRANYTPLRLISGYESVDAFPRDISSRTEKMRMRAAA
jgi:hypothetical protein